jgi:hypothetical protein
VQLLTGAAVARCAVPAAQLGQVCIAPRDRCKLEEAGEQCMKLSFSCVWMTLRISINLVLMR